ncbi:uncharacterized protein DUF349 [Algoriphagus boseongensis]|uniref:Uncharacterized protein DUF349 n=1 Tax=Algoriphagus boseongensis TaxID=1442587 RepID=A0A4R6T8G8_9BACT|nr:DUF349 domain-containing protein [Algoriphagus boseongensis]TDQ19006.1 uncharacterized protein DUF349 [Algoriphagus boseongensis]
MSEKSNELSENDKVTQASAEEVTGKKEVSENQVDSSEEANPVEDSAEIQEVSSEVESQIIEETPTVTEKNPAKEEEAPTEEVSAVSESSTVENSESESHDSELAEEEESEEEDLDLSVLSKVQLLKLLKDKIHHGNVLKIDKLAHEIKEAFEELENKDKEEALNKFKAEGGIEEDFEYHLHEEEREFHKVFNDFRHQLYSLRKEAEKQKEKNLEAKTELLNKLRDLVDGEETTLSMNAIKAIQEEWKSIGPVPASQNRNLWASFNALMDRYYDNRSIYFELKELDRKKNLESKLELCEKVEALKEVKDLKEAIKQLNELHEEFKHVGPVPRSDQEELWQRFKGASDAIYDRRKVYYEGQKEVYKENQTQKEALIAKLAEYANFSADRIKDWNAKTKEILDIQKDWEKIGPVPREAGKEINKAFWSAFKQFFHHKNLFFKQLDEVRATNQKKAEDLISLAEALVENTDWQNTANQLIKLQQEWKKLGPTPEKFRDALYKKFKTACDTFFENRRNSNKQANSEFDANLKKKQEVIAKIIELAKGSSASEDELTALVSEFNEIGFVPRKNIKDIQNEFKAAVEKYLDKLNPSGENKDDFLFRLNLNKIQNDPNAVKTFNKKEHGIRKQIADLENSITLWKNNLEFFAASKTADKLKDQFDIKIQKAEEEIEKLKKKLSILREF